ncbi:tetratricopeptide repeat protein [Nannocystis pusilla]|uniref:tetratricopeptide repeat protein n=1 Tax=Nannocystis pusilla TaxID=889268 RepID=UPI003B79D194
MLAASPGHPDALAVLAGAALARDDQAAYARLRDQAVTANPLAFYLALADLLVSMHMYEQTGTVLDEAAKRAPDNAYVQSAMGLNLLRLGKETEGRAALKAAWKRDRFNERTRNTLDLYDQRIDPLYTDVSDGDLSLRLLKEDQEYVSGDMLAIIARARQSLDKRYALRPTPLRIEVFADPSDFSVRTIGVPSLGAVGVCFGRLITALGPYAGTHNFHQVVWHELAHVYAVQLSKAASRGGSPRACPSGSPSSPTRRGPARAPSCWPSPAARAPCAACPSSSWRSCGPAAPRPWRSPTPPPPTPSATSARPTACRASSPCSRATARAAPPRR